MNLKLWFCPEELRYKRHSPTAHEINELAIAAQSIEAIVDVMADYDCDTQDKEAVSNCLSVFTVLKWLIEPIETYLENYAGEPTAPEEEAAPEEPSPEA
jgi:hypothetical protein